MRFGVNYVPSKNWWYSWVDWNKYSIEEDLHAIASLGMDHIRAHCLWSIFQPNSTYVSETAIDRVQELLEIADKCGLDVELTVLNGFLSGFAFYPTFSQATAWEKRKNIFTNPNMIKAEKYLLSKIAERIGKHKRFLGFDIGNEINVLQSFGDTFTISEGDKWLVEMMQFCEHVAPGKIHVNGVDHSPWFNDIAFSREKMAKTGAVTSIHTWIEFTGALQKYGPMETGCTHLTEYCIELAKAYNTDKDRLVWVQEFGASPDWMPENIISDFAEQTIIKALTCENVWGFTWWCSHNLDRKLEGFHSLEYDLGLLDHMNNVKSVGKRMAELIKRYKANPIEAIERPIALVLPDELFACNKEDYQYPDNPGWKLAKQYMSLIDEGIRPSIVLERSLSNSEYLISRGIKELRQIY